MTDALSTYVLPDELRGAGMEEIRPDELVIPRYRRLEALSKADGQEPHPGWYFNSITKQQVKTIPCVILRVQHGRTCFAGKGRELLCASSDGLVPRDQYVGKYAQKCAKCPKGKWGANRQRPECSLNYTFLSMERTPQGPGMPFMITLSGTSIKHVKSFLTNMQFRFKGILFAAPVIIHSSDRITGDLGAWYETLIEVDEEALSAGYDWRPYYDWYQTFRATSIQDDAAEDTTEEDVVSTGGGAEVLDLDEIPF